MGSGIATRKKYVTKIARHSIVPITASGTQDEKSLVDGEKFVREVGKLELYLRKKVWLGRRRRTGGGLVLPKNLPFIFVPSSPALRLGGRSSAREGVFRQRLLAGGGTLFYLSTVTYKGNPTV